ncbi:ATP-binding protein [Streptomyces albus]|uniref:ATP-binding protein n=4 Tax=Streptomyces albus TaxID=1888 RepID=UPI0037AD9A06
MTGRPCVAARAPGRDQLDGRRPHVYAAPARRESAATTAPLSGSTCDPTAPAARTAHAGWQLSIPARERNIARARAAFTRWLGQPHDPPIPEETADDAVLLLSELTTNAVVHTRCLPDAELLCRAAVAPRGTSRGALLRIEVHDPSEGDECPHLKRSEAGDESGRGLCIVAALAADWGVRRSTMTAGNAVWATLRLPLDGPAPRYAQ